MPKHYGGGLRRGRPRPRPEVRWEVTKQKRAPEGHSSAAVAVENELYYFGSKHNDNEGFHIDVHVFNTVSLCWRKLTPTRSGRGQWPPGSWSHTAVLAGDTVYLWGGAWREDLLYAFDVDAHRWSKHRVSGTVPEPQYDHCVLGKVVFVYRDRTYRQTGYTNEIYKLDTTTMVWSLVNTRGTPPPASSRQSVTIIGKKMFVFGGSFWDFSMAQTYYNDLSVFDTETNVWLDTPPAPSNQVGRVDHSAFSYKGELYIFHHITDLWRFSPETLSWKKVVSKGKGPDRIHSMCCCTVGDRVFLFGGYRRGDTAPCEELYVLNLSLQIPSLKVLCKTAGLRYGLDQSELPHNIRWELAAMELC